MTRIEKIQDWVKLQIKVYQTAIDKTVSAKDNADSDLLNAIKETQIEGMKDTIKELEEIERQLDALGSF